MTHYEKFCGTELSSIGFLTMRMPCLNPYYELFYGGGKRQVPNNIGELLNPVSLSYWIMDDGSKHNAGLHLNVYAFNDQSVDRLMQVLQTKYLLTCSVHNHAKGKRISIFGAPTLRNIVLPVPSMYYKLGTVVNLTFYHFMQFYDQLVLRS